mmetsp:Transcript_87123/g.154188  ORF Transcript_87123/g.154188 Transcript_87123/m.154188 type:complete len:538 (+) Transcript_87123:91-1704(+)
MQSLPAEAWHKIHARFPQVEPSGTSPASPKLSQPLPSKQGFHVEVLPGKALDGPHDLVPVVVRLSGPDGSEVTKSDFVCIIDISGSMGTEATIQGAGGEAERHGLSLLDVAKHGVRTIAKSLSADDRLCIIAFNHTAAMTLELTKMDEDGQQKMEDKLDELNSGGGTDIWTGLAKGLDVLKSDGECVPGAGRFAHIMLLTDGVSTNANTIVPNLEAFRAKHECLPCTITTFGFGYGIDSRLLQEIAELGDGSYCFIPDAGFVGTCFVNTMSNLLVAAAREVFLQLEPEDGASIVAVATGLVSNNSSDVTTIRLGTLHYGQSREVVVSMSTTKSGPCLTANARFLTPVDKVPQETEASTSPVESSEDVVQPHVCRAKFVDSILDSMTEASQSSRLEHITEEGLASMKDALRLLSEDVRASSASSSAAVSSLLEDIEGQASEAVSKVEYFRKWGRHYLPSLMFAHRLQQCNNFKDPGVQAYGGSLFEDVRDRADENFNKLPAPKPSVRRVSYSGGGGSYGGGYTAAPVDMSAYNNRYGG